MNDKESGKNSYSGHSDGTPEGSNDTSSQNEEGGVDNELVSGTTKVEKGVGWGLFGYQKRFSINGGKKSRAHVFRLAKR
jgi:hypothetical protein